MPTCKRCGATESFYKSQPSYCKDCMRTMSRNWERANPEQRRLSKLKYQRRPDVKLKRKARYIESAHGLLPGQFDDLLTNQQSKCGICGTEISNEPNHKTHIDHDHVSGRIRGLLCDYCNHGLGNFKDDMGLLQKAIEYLQK